MIEDFRERITSGTQSFLTTTEKGKTIEALREYAGRLRWLLGEGLDAQLPVECCRATELEPWLWYLAGCECLVLLTRTLVGKAARTPIENIETLRQHFEDKGSSLEGSVVRLYDQNTELSA